MSDDLPASFGREFEPRPEEPPEPPAPPQGSVPPPTPDRAGDFRPRDTGPGSPPPPGAPPHRHPTSWPGVFGVLGIIFGSLGALGKLGSFSWPIFRPWMMEWISRSVPRHEYDFIREFMPHNAYILSSGIIELGLAVLLLVAGIHLLKRRQSGARLIKLWAIISIPWALLESGFGMSITRDLIPRLHDYGVHDIPFVGFFTSVGIGIGLLFALAVPIFVLAWFASRRIATEVEGWPA